MEKIKKRGPYKKSEPDAFIPEYIKLPDGREFKTNDLLGKSSKSKHISLVKGFTFKSRPTPKNPWRHVTPDGRKTKYSFEERQWQAESSVKEIAERYGMSDSTARVTRMLARRAIQVKPTTTSTDTGIIFDYTQNNNS